MQYARFFLGLFYLVRPLEWSKSLGNMVIAALTAAMIFKVGVGIELFLQGFASLALLWCGLYALNDYTDRQQDALHPIKKDRPIPSGMVKPLHALLFSLLLITVSGFIAAGINSLIVLCWAVMLANQVFYTMKPFNFKKKPVLDLVSGSMVNPVFRFYYGWGLLVPAFNAPIVVLLFILGIQFGGYGLYRMMSKGFEKSMKTKSSVVVFGEKNIKTVFYAALVMGVVSYFIASLTVWKQSYFWMGIVSLFTVPFYYKAIMNPETTDMKKQYLTVYLHYLIFIAGFAMVYLFF